MDGRSVVGRRAAGRDQARLEVEERPLRLERERPRRAVLRQRDRLEVAVDQAVPHHLLGDVSRIRQTLMNLAGNALKFTGSGHILLSVRRSGEKLLFEDLSFELPRIAPDPGQPKQEHRHHAPAVPRHLAR